MFFASKSGMIPPSLHTEPPAHIPGQTATANGCIFPKNLIFNDTIDKNLKYPLWSSVEREHGPSSSRGDRACPKSQQNLDTLLGNANRQSQIARQIHCRRCVHIFDAEDTEPGSGAVTTLIGIRTYPGCAVLGSAISIWTAVSGIAVVGFRSLAVIGPAPGYSGLRTILSCSVQSCFVIYF